VPSGSVDSVTGEALKTFPEHTNEQTMNAHKTHRKGCVLRSLVAEGGMASGTRCPKSQRSLALVPEATSAASIAHCQSLLKALILLAP